MLDGMLSSDEAARFYNSDIWSTWTEAQIAGLWLYQTYATIPFDNAHEAIEECLGRTVELPEFADRPALRAEFEGLGFAEFTLDAVLATLTPEQLALLELS